MREEKELGRIEFWTPFGPGQVNPVASPKSKQCWAGLLYIEGLIFFGVNVQAFETGGGTALMLLGYLLILFVRIRFICRDKLSFILILPTIVSKLQRLSALMATFS